MKTTKREQAVESFIRQMVKEHRDWQEIAVETIEHFDWLTQKDDWDRIVGLITTMEQEGTE